MKPRVSAIIVNYKSSPLTARAVASLMAGQNEVGVEVVVVDNSEAESEREALQRLATPGVKLIINPSNEGFGRACNRAYTLASGAYILLLNPDAYLRPGALGHLVRFLDTHPEAGAVCPLVYWDDKGNFMLPPSDMPSPFHCVRDAVIGSSGGLVRLYQHWHRRRALRVLRANHATREAALSGGLALLRRTAVDASGGLFDPAFFLYFEDADLFRRMRRTGYRLYREPKAHAVHNYNQCGAAMAGEKRKFMQEAQDVFMKKYDPRGRVRRLCAWLRKVLPKTAQPAAEYLGVLAEPPAFSVPRALSAQWVLEWSPNMNLIPAAVRFGSGDIATFPGEAWRLLRPGTYYTRLGSPDSFFSYKTWCWDVQ